MAKKKDSTPQTYWILMWVTIGVLALWFGMGFLVPYFIFPKWEYSGQFGDGFGSVSSLFSGIGFIAVAYTVLLQVQANRAQKNQDKFEINIKLIDDLKFDLENVQHNGVRGATCITLLNGMIQQNNPNIINTNGVFRYLFVVTTYFIALADEFFNKKHEDSRKYEILRQKLIVLYFLYLNAIHTTMQEHPQLPLRDVPVLEGFRANCETLDRKIDDFFELNGITDDDKLS